MNAFIEELKKYYPHEHADGKKPYRFVGGEAKAIVNLKFIAARIGADLQEYRKTYNDKEEIPIVKFDDEFLYLNVGFLSELKVIPNHFRGFKIVKQQKNKTN